MPEMRVLYENLSVQKGVKPAWGFAALVTYGKKNILFDTGGRPDILLSNMRAMKISPATVSDVFISHNHWDHTGGLFSFLSKNHDVKVYLPISFSETYQKEVLASGAECSRIKEFTRIAKDIYSSGTVGGEVPEQALIIDTPKGLVVMTGCAHPGILKIVKAAKSSLKKPVYAVLGGFHLYPKSTVETKSIISEFKSLGVSKVAPCHCTGEKVTKQFKAEYKDGFIQVGAGSFVNL